jgi:hypothetical protein
VAHDKGRVTKAGEELPPGASLMSHVSMRHTSNHGDPSDHLIVNPVCKCTILFSKISYQAVVVAKTSWQAITDPESSWVQVALFAERSQQAGSSLLAESSCEAGGYLLAQVANFLPRALGKQLTLSLPRALKKQAPARRELRQLPACQELWGSR